LFLFKPFCIPFLPSFAKPALVFPSSLLKDYKRKIIQLDDKKYYQLTIWDTAGQERFRTITQAYFRGAHGMLLVFDVGSEKTFKSVEHWMNQIGSHVAEIQKDSSHAVAPKVILVGNKADIPEEQRQVSKEKAQAMAEKWGIGYIETSAKDNTNVQEAFMTITKLIAPTLSLNTADELNLSGGRGLAEVGASEKKGCAC
jgi:small GTP-binding protein